jgi:Copper transport outer membrane protein, MctB
VIDFRYHVVSLVAVLIALATGILLGSSVLSGPLYDNLNKTTDQLRQERDQLRSDISDLERDKSYAANFAEALSPEVVAQRLAAEQAVVVTLPGAQKSTVQQVAKMLETAGAEVTGQIGITDAYAETDKERVLDDLVNQLRPLSVEMPQDSSTYDRAAIEIAAAVMTKEISQAGSPPTGAEGGVLPGLKAGGFITTNGHPERMATMAVLVAGPAPEEADGVDRANNAYLAIARELDAGGRSAVVGGPESAAGDRGVVNALRSNDSLASAVSSVDTADTIYGQIAVVYALEADAAGQTGQYGISGTTDGPLPTASPEPQSP